MAAAGSVCYTRRMAPRQERVVLIDIRWRSGSFTVSPGRLKSWAMADPLIEAGLRIDIVEASTADEAPKIARAVAAGNPRVVGFSIYLWNFRTAFEAIRLVKQDCPETLIVVGGDFATDFAQECLRDNPAVDVVAVGEGEETFRRLLRSYVLENAGFKDVPGLCYRDGDVFIKTPRPEPLDTSRLTPVYATGLARPSGKGGLSLLEGSRGCPLTCSFCAWGIGSDMRYLPSDHLREEFSFLADKTSLICMTDSDLLINRKRGLEVLKLFLEATKDSDTPLNFHCNPTFLAPEVVDVIAQAPAKFHVNCGLQSIEPQVLEAVDRPMRLDLVERNIADLRRRAPATLYRFTIIYGLPKDTLAGFRRTVNWTLKQRTASVVSHRALVLPATQLSRDADRYGLVYSRQPPWPVSETPTMPLADMSRAARLAFCARLFLGVMRGTGALERLLSSCADSGRPLAYVELLEGWMAFMERASLDLTLGRRPEEFADPMLWEEYIDESIERVLIDPLQRASLDRASILFSERRVPALAASS